MVQALLQVLQCSWFLQCKKILSNPFVTTSKSVLVIHYSKPSRTSTPLQALTTWTAHLSLDERLVIARSQPRFRSVWNLLLSSKYQDTYDNVKKVKSLKKGLFRILQRAENLLVGDTISCIPYPPHFSVIARHMAAESRRKHPDMKLAKPPQTLRLPPTGYNLGMKAGLISATQHALTNHTRDCSGNVDHCLAVSAPKEPEKIPRFSGEVH